MAMSRSKKKVYVNEISGMSDALSIVGMNYAGLPGNAMTLLRKQAREAGVKVRVSKNTLVRRVFQENEFSVIADDIRGPVLLLFSWNEPGAAAKIAEDLTKRYDFLKVCAIGLSGDRISPERLSYIASLPNRDQALSMLLNVLMAGPRHLAIALQEVAKKLTAGSA